MFESTIILTKQDILTWASAGTLTGTLTPSVGDAFDWRFVAERDRQLARRDTVLANTIADVASMVQTVWGGKVQYSAPPEPSDVQMPGAMPVVTNVAGTIAHVKPSSTPVVAFSVDDELVKRDTILLEGLRQVAAKVPDAVISSTLPAAMSLTVAWSLAEGEAKDIAINPILPLNVEAIKDPDVTLAERDNQIAANIAQLRQVLRNPFVSATRLVIQSTSDPHEAESYVLVFEDNDRKIWQAEPGLEGRMRIIYDKAHQSLAWYDENAVAPLYYGQPYSVGGTIAGGAEFLPYLEDRKDVEFWRQKALQVNTLPIREVMVSQMLDPGYYSRGDMYEDRGNAIFVRPGVVVTNLTGTIPSGLARCSLLFTPQSEVVVDGAKGIGGTTGDGTYTDFPAAGGTIIWDLKLPAGAWSMSIYYTNLVGTPAPLWPFLVQLNSTVISNLGLKIYEDNGVVQHSDYYLTSTGGDETLTLSWAPADSSNQLRIERIVFTRTTNEQIFDLSARLGQVVGGTLGTGVTYGPEVAEFDGYPFRPDTISFVFAVEETITNPALELTWSNPGSIGLTPLNIDQVEITTFDFPTVTKNAEGFDGWAGEMAARAADSVVESFRAGVRINPTFEPTELLNGLRYWTTDSTMRWLELLRTLESRFDLAFRTGGPGDIGRPALIPKGVEFDVVNEVTPRETTLEVEVTGTVTPFRAISTVPGTLCYPRLGAFQPWMATLRLPVMREAFWAESMAQLRLLPLNLHAEPPEGGTVSGAGLYPYGSTVNILATPNPDRTIIDVAVDIVYVVDESASMSVEQQWVGDITAQINTALLAANIGTGVYANRYGLVGFCNDHGPQTDPTGHTHQVGGSYFGTQAQLVTAVGTLGLQGTMNKEDAYTGIHTAVGYPWRVSDRIVKIIIALTDEDRDIRVWPFEAAFTGDYLAEEASDLAAIKAELLGLDIKLAMVTENRLQDSGNQEILGYRYNGTAYRYDGGTGFTASTGGHYESTTYNSGYDGLSILHEFVWLVDNADIDGTVWDIAQISLSDHRRTAMGAAFVDAIKNQVIQALLFQGWYNPDGTLFSSNQGPLAIQMTKPTSLEGRFIPGHV